MKDIGGCTEIAGREPVLTATDDVIVVDVRETDTAVVVDAVDTAVATDVGALRGIALSEDDTLEFCCVACTVGMLVIGTYADAIPANARSVMDTHELSTAAVEAELRP